MNRLLWLVYNGIPLSPNSEFYADELSPGEMFGMEIIFARIQGQEFNWNTRRYEPMK